MANEGDYGHRAEEFFRQMAIENARNATGNERLTGFCQNDCGERTEPFALRIVVMTLMLDRG